MNMSEQWYEVRTDEYGSAGAIKPVEVERYTDKSVWISGSRQAMQSSWSVYVKGQIAANEMSGNIISIAIERRRDKIDRLNDQIDALEIKLNALY